MSCTFHGKGPGDHSKVFGTHSNDFGTDSNDIGTSGIVFGTLSKGDLVHELYLACSMTNTLSTDQIFISKLREIVEANLSKEEFDVEELAREAHMSRSSIHRKLRNLGKLNASHFIREIRLFKARGMLRDGLVTAAEVSYRTGFGSPAYFSKCYHEFYGYPPGEEKRRIVTDGPDQQDILPGATEFGRPAAAGVNLNTPKQKFKEPLSFIRPILQRIKDLLSYL